MADVSYEGIEGIKPEDIAQAAELGFVVKLVGVRYVADRVNVRVGPVLVPCEHPLASVAGSDNAVLREEGE